MMRALVFLLAATPAGAVNFTPPQDCTLELTVQNRSCSVAQYYRCDADAPGDQRAVYFGPNGATYASRIDSETRWMESLSVESGITDTLVEDAADHASFTTLIDTGFDDFDFWTEDADGNRLRYVGQDTLTGETLTIDGQTLEVTSFELKAFDADGQEILTRSGNQFIDRTQRRFYGGKETMTDWTGAVVNSDDSPVSFHLPGQPGFGDTTPQYDCNMLMTQLLHGKAAL